MEIKRFCTIQEELKNFLYKEKDHELDLTRILMLMKLMENTLIKTIHKKKTKSTENHPKIIFQTNKNVKCKKTNFIYPNFKIKFFSISIEPKLRARDENLNKIYYKNLTKNKISPHNFSFKIFEISHINTLVLGDQKNFHLKNFRDNVEFYLRYFKNEIYQNSLFSSHHFKKKGFYLFLIQSSKENIWLKNLKKLDFCKKNHKNFTYSILKLFYFLQKTLRQKSELLFFGDIFNQKENYCSVEFLKSVNSHSFPKSTVRTFYKKFYGNTDKKREKIQLALSGIGYFLSNYNRFKMDLKNFPLKLEEFKTFLIKNPINSLLYLSLFAKKLRVYARRLRISKGCCFFIKIFLIRTTQILFRRGLSVVEQDKLYLISKIFFIWISYFHKSQKKYLLTFLNRVTQTCHSYVINSKFKKKKTAFHDLKIFFIVIQNLKWKINRFSHFNSENFFFCKSCLIKHFLIFLRKGSLHRPIFFWGHMSAAFFILPTLKNLMFSIIINLINENVKKKFDLKFVVENFNYLDLVFCRTSKEKFSLFYQENIHFLTVMKNFKIFQERFLFILYLVTRKFFKKFSTRRSLVYKPDMGEIKKNFQIMFANCWSFLLNYLFEFSPLNTFFKEDLIIKKVKIKKEILMIIGPNRDFSVFNINHLNNFNRKHNSKANFNLWQNRFIYMGHFSRSKKLSFFNYYLFKNNEFGQIFEFNGKVSESINPTLNSIDKKLSRSFLFFTLKINEKYVDSPNFIMNDFFFKQNISNSETFFKKSNKLIENKIKNIKNYIKNNKILGQTKTINNGPFFVSHRLLVRDRFETLYSFKNIKEVIKLCDYRKFSKNFLLDFFPPILISAIIYKHPFNSLFSNLCSFSLLQLCPLKTRLNCGLNKTSINILKVTKTSIREHFFVVKKKSSSLFKICRVNFFQLALLTKIIWNIKKKNHIYKKISRSFGKNILDIKTDLISDFSEFSLLNNLCGKVRLI